LASTVRRKIFSAFPVQASSESYLNLVLSFEGLRQLGFAVSGIVDQTFQQPMGKLALSLGDPIGTGGQPDYVIGSDWSQTPDLLLLLGSDSPDRLELVRRELTQEAEAAGCQTMYSEEGVRLPGGTEHFGFRDGISQAGPRGFLTAGESDYLTPRYLDSTDPRAATFAKPGQPLVWPGQFVFGYPTQRDDPSIPGGVADGGEPWILNGSFLVFRRLRQDVLAFREFLKQSIPLVASAFGRGVDEESVGALLVGRWKDGSPLIVTPRNPNPIVASDPLAVNFFQFANPTVAAIVMDEGSTRTIPGSAGDPFGQRCPFTAHIRKVNPRDRTTNQGGPGRTLQFQMLRRGIPFGSVFTPETAGDERGLLFLAFMTSLDGQFMILNSDWMNNAAAPEALIGQDLLVGQSGSTGIRTATLTGPLGQVTLTSGREWVIPPGGGFFFAPSRSLIRSL
jgi:Dyp-type peroxidase family